ncbi:MAG: hypothetical protein ACRC7N_14440 [Clostridium sp.]
MKIYGIDIDGTNEDNEKRQFLIANLVGMIVISIIFFCFYKYFNYFGIPILNSGEFTSVKIFNLAYKDEILMVFSILFIFTLVIRGINFISFKYPTITEIVIIILKITYILILRTLFTTVDFWNLNLPVEVNNYLNIGILNNINFISCINILWYIILLSKLIEVIISIYKIIKLK